ncbi:hypothetical protein BU23DRAFT_601367 [Bimuria novae-zelandiae CBS 107.79]|uniref:Uncharacterized protein n=1 Tax=Bimuria novae-zelandiae CBS 107.79 TaxID=1447943 RepID=A0A6A5UXP6_9PLEO|nr:hypothetical protein BU23DRAFT_601367 [Bimuria novae-zelandiae CBS 107.79]
MSDPSRQPSEHFPSFDSLPQGPESEFQQEETFATPYLAPEVSYDSPRTYLQSAYGSAIDSTPPSMPMPRVYSAPSAPNQMATCGIDPSCPFLSSPDFLMHQTDPASPLVPFVPAHAPMALTDFAPNNFMAPQVDHAFPRPHISPVPFVPIAPPAQPLPLRPTISNDPPAMPPQQAHHAGPSAPPRPTWRTQNMKVNIKASTFCATGTRHLYFTIPLRLSSESDDFRYTTYSYPLNPTRPFADQIFDLSTVIKHLADIHTLQDDIPTSARECMAELEGQRRVGL